MISIGAIGSALATVVLDRLLGRTLGNDMVTAGVLGGFAGSLCGPLYDRHVARRVRALLQQQFGARLPVRCQIELRPAGLWGRQEGVDIELDWTMAEAVEDTTDGVELWFRWGLVIARNRGFATSSDRERFIEQARALSLTSQALPDKPSA